MLPAAFVDALPERLWFLGNIFTAFGRTVHFCVGGESQRTIELDGVEIGRGRRTLTDFHDTPSDDVAIRLWTIDFGWAALALVGAVIGIAALLGRRGRT